MRNKKKIIRAVTVPQSICFFEEVMEKQKAEGLQTIVVSSPDVEFEEFRQRHPDARTIEVPMARHISLKEDIVSLMRMILVFMKERPYVVHSMTPKAGLICMMAAWLTRVPVRIHMFTGLIWPTATGVKRKILMLTDKILCACATHIIPEGEGVKHDLQTYITKKPMKVLGYGNCKGVDMERFDPARFQDVSESFNVSGCFTFLFVGRIVGDKGINELVEAFCKLADKSEELGVKVKLVLIGRYEKDLDPVSELTQQRIDANDAIVVPGPRYGDDLLKEYTKADCFVFPSYREGFPNTVLEAGAMGLPQIVTDINGAREIVTGEVSKDFNELQKVSRVSEGFNASVGFNASEGFSGKICKNGIIIPPKDADALYEAMLKMVTDEAMRKTMAKNARPMIESRFEKNFVQGCQIEFYKKILGE